jgi:hypothetical protein
MSMGLDRGGFMRSTVSDTQTIYVLVQEQSRDGMRGRHAYLIDSDRRDYSCILSFKSPVR